MINNPIIFYTAFFCIIFFTLLSLSSKNIIYSLLYAVIAFWGGALIFFLLGSEYNAIIQAAVYGLAVPIIIGLSIMFASGNSKYKNGFTLPYITILCGLIFIMAFIYLTLNSFHTSQSIQINSYDVILSFAKGIFIDYVWGFELLSLLLTIVIAGFSLFKKKGA